MCVFRRAALQGEGGSGDANYDMEQFIDKRWEQAEYEDEDENDLDNSSARLFERSRIKALAGLSKLHSGLFTCAGMYFTHSYTCPIDTLLWSSWNFLYKTGSGLLFSSWRFEVLENYQVFEVAKKQTLSAYTCHNIPRFTTCYLILTLVFTLLLCCFEKLPSLDIWIFSIHWKSDRFGRLRYVIVSV